MDFKELSRLVEDNFKKMILDQPGLHILGETETDIRQAFTQIGIFSRTYTNIQKICNPLKCKEHEIPSEIADIKGVKFYAAIALRKDDLPGFFALMCETTAHPRVYLAHLVVDDEKYARERPCIDWDFSQVPSSYIEPYMVYAASQEIL